MTKKQKNCIISTKTELYVTHMQKTIQMTLYRILKTHIYILVFSNEDKMLDLYNDTKNIIAEYLSNVTVTKIL